MKKIDYNTVVDSLNTMVSSISAVKDNDRHLQDSIKVVFRLTLECAFDNFRDICKVLKEEGNITVLEINQVFVQSLLSGKVHENIRNKLPKEWFMEDGTVKQTYSKFFTDYYKDLSDIFTSELS